MEWMIKAEETNVDDKIKRFVELSKKEKNDTLTDAEYDEWEKLDSSIESLVADAMWKDIKDEVSAEVDNLVDHAYKAIPENSDDKLVKKIASDVVLHMISGKYKIMKDATNNLDTDFVDEIQNTIMEYAKP